MWIHKWNALAEIYIGSVVTTDIDFGYFVLKNKVKNTQVPWQKITVIKNSQAVMIGTEEFKGRCESLEGVVGESCKCKIYSSRPDVCESFPVWLNNGLQNPKCMAARKHHGLKTEIE